MDTIDEVYKEFSRARATMEWLEAEEAEDEVKNEKEVEKEA